MPLTVGTNSYATLAEAEAYLYESFRGPDWNTWAPPTAPTDPSILTNQEIALVTAARLIDRQPLRGSKLDSAQALAFPRDDQLDGVPLEVKHAQIETAYWLLTVYRRERTREQPKVDLAEFLHDGALTTGIKLAVQGVTVDDGSDGDGPTKNHRITFTPAQAAPVVQLPTELPPAALVLLKEHLQMGLCWNGERIKRIIGACQYQRPSRWGPPEVAREPFSTATDQNPDLLASSQLC